MRKLSLQFLIASLLLCVQSVSLGHSLSFLEGKATISDKKVEIVLNVRPDDVMLSAGVPFIIEKVISKQLLDYGVEVHKEYLLGGIAIKNDAGKRLVGKVVKVEAPEIPEAGILQADLMASMFVYHIEYELAVRPKQLGFLQKFDMAKTAMPVAVQLEFLRPGQKRGPVFPLPMGNLYEIITMDWEDETRQIITGEPMLQPADIFVYIEKSEVRVEILMPFETLESWFTIPQEDTFTITVAEQEASRAKMEKWFTQFNEVEINGVRVKPKLVNLSFMGVDAWDFSKKTEPKDLDPFTTRVGVILSYPTKESPKDLAIKWTMFNDKATWANGVVFTDEGGKRIKLSNDKPDFRWVDERKVLRPEIQLVSVAGKNLEELETRKVITETLLRNVYRGFDYGNDSEVYDTLAKSVHGDLLTKLYIEIKKSLIVRDEGGATSKVQKVSVLKLEDVDLSKDKISQKVTWQVEGTVEHWAHIHTRVNEYVADITIQDTDGSWKITAFKVAKQSYINGSMSVRKL